MSTVKDFGDQVADMVAEAIEQTPAAPRKAPMGDWVLVLAEVIERVTRHDVEVASIDLVRSLTSKALQVDVQFGSMSLTGAVIDEDAVDLVAPEFRAGPAVPSSTNYVRDGAMSGTGQDGRVWSTRVRLYSSRTRQAGGCCSGDCPCRKDPAAPAATAVAHRPVEGGGGS